MNKGVKLSKKDIFSCTNIFLFLILTIGVIVRVWGIDFDSPYMHFDEGHFVGIPFYFIRTGDLNPHYFHKPTFLIYLLYFIYSTLFIFKPALKLLVYCDPLFFMVGRIFCALLGASTVFLVYILGKIAFSKKVGLISALFLCFAFLHVSKSHFIAVDVPMTFFIVLSFVFIYKGYLSGKTSDFIYAGIFGGLAASTKYPGAVLAVPIFFANFFYVINNKRKKRKVLFSKRLILSAISMIFAFLIGSPYIAFNYLNFKSNLFSQVRHMQRGHFGFGLEVANHWIYHLTNTLPQGMGLILFLFSLGGIVYILYKRRQNGIFLLIFPLTFYLLIASFRTLFDRYAIPLIPFLSLFAGYFFIEIINKLHFKKRKWKKVITIILIVFLIGESAAKTVYQDWLYTREDTRTQCKKWIEENIPAHAFIGRTWYDNLQLAGAELPVEEEFRRISTWHTLKKIIKRKHETYFSKKAKRKYYMTSTNKLIRYIRRKDIDSLSDKSQYPDYAIFSSCYLFRLYRYPDKFQRRIAAWETLIRNSQLLRTFSPYRNPDESRWFIPNESIFYRIYPGDLIKIYKIDKDSLIADLKNNKGD